VCCFFFHGHFPNLSSVRVDSVSIFPFSCLDHQQRSIELQESESRAQQVQQMGKSTLAIAQKGFEVCLDPCCLFFVGHPRKFDFCRFSIWPPCLTQEKLKSLRKLASEQESALSEDERTIDSLRQTIAQLQRQSGSSGGAVVDTAGSEEGIAACLLVEMSTISPPRVSLLSLCLSVPSHCRRYPPLICAQFHRPPRAKPSARMPRCAPNSSSPMPSSRPRSPRCCNCSRAPVPAPMPAPVRLPLRRPRSPARRAVQSATSQ
jgi:hypothetical protein